MKILSEEAAKHITKAKVIYKPEGIHKNLGPIWKLICLCEMGVDIPEDATLHYVCLSLYLQHFLPFKGARCVVISPRDGVVYALQNQKSAAYLKLYAAIEAALDNEL